MSGTYPPPGYGGQRPNYGDEPEYNWSERAQGEQPGYGNQPGGQPGYGGGQPNYGGGQPGYGGGQPGYGEGGGGYGAGQPTYGGGQPGYGGDPRYGNDPGYGGGQPDYGSGQPGYGGGQPTYGGGQGGGYGGQPGYGGGQPAYGGGQGGYGGGYGESSPGYASPNVPSQGYPAHDTQPYGSGYGDYSSGQPPTPSVPLPPAAAPKRKRGKVLVTVLAVVLGLLLVCGIGGYIAARPYLAEWPAKLAKPEKVAGLELSTEPALQQAANEIAASIRKDVQIDEAMAAFYHDPKADEKIVALVGGTAFLMSPKAELDEAFRSAGSDGMAIQGIQDVDAGPLGGLARCGTAEQEADRGQKVPVSVCAWADHGSLVIGLFFNRPVEESAALLRQIRSEILTR